MSAFLFTSNRELFCLKVDDFLVENGRQLMEIASEYNGGVPVEELSIIHNGHLISEDSKLRLKAGDVCHANLRLLGGKGGFGSMLRALGAQIEKTTNREACRDLSGRRMRDINDEKKIAEWVSKQADREREKERQRQEQMERKRRMPRHTFDDASYTKHIQDNSERVEDALQQGFKAAGIVASSSSSTTTEKTTVKRVHSDEPTSSGGSKKSRMWLGMDDLDSDDNEDTFPASENSSSTVSSFSSTRVEPSTSYDSLDNNYDTDTRVETHPMATTALQGQVNNNELDKEDKTEGIHGEVAVLQATTKEDGPSKDRSSAEKQDTEKLSHQKIKICLEDYTSAEELKSVGLDQLKEELMARGLKCGGTLQQRAQRLFSTKGVPLNQLDPSLFAKTTGSKKLNGKKN